MAAHSTDLDDANHISRHGLAAIIWSSFSVATIFVISRLSVRIYSHRRLQTDDVWIILAWASMLTMCIVDMMQQESIWYTADAAEGDFVPVQTTLQWHQEQLSRWQFASINLFWIALWSVKASFLAIFLQLVHPFATRRRLWYVVTIFVALAFLGCIISNIFTCNSPSEYFRAGGCSSGAELYRQRFSILFSTMLDIVSNIAIIALPLSVLPLLNLDKRKKIGLGVVFTLNLFVVAVSIARMTQIIIDTTIDLVGLNIWSTVETSVALIIGSLPPLRGLLSRRVRKYKANKSGGFRIDNDFDPQQSYPLGSVSRTVMKVESIPMDDAHRGTLLDGGIYVQRMFETQIETQMEIHAETNAKSSLEADADIDTSSRDDLSDDVVAIVKPKAVKKK